MWLEMTRDSVHGGAGWGLGECLWSPTYKNPKGSWPFWDVLKKIKRGDLVLHLVGKTNRQVFDGYSVAAADGAITSERPPAPGAWGYANSYYRVPLVSYQKFADPIKLAEVFSAQDGLLREYFRKNKTRQRAQKELLFFVEQAGRLQCLNGAYMSEVSDELGGILLGPDFSGSQRQQRLAAISANTGEQIAQIRARAGQSQFSRNVKDNFGNKCCFPGCDIEESAFLVGAHIARWADHPDLRGRTDNGLCLCLIHDKAFEIGLFTITEDFYVSVNADKAAEMGSLGNKLIAESGKKIKGSQIKPAVNAIKAHWGRIGFGFGGFQNTKFLGEA